VQNRFPKLDIFLFKVLLVSAYDVNNDGLNRFS